MWCSDICPDFRIQMLNTEYTAVQNIQTMRVVSFIIQNINIYIKECRVAEPAEREPSLN